MKEDKMEDKTKIRDGVKEWAKVWSAFFDKQIENQMFVDLKIKKGFFIGIKYLIFLLFVLPAKILSYMINPQWAWVNFVQRHLVSPIFEIDALTGSESPSRLLGEIYEKNLNFFTNTEDSGVKSSKLKPSISVLERIMIFAKLRKIITLVFFIYFGFFMGEYFYGILYQIVNMIVVAITFISALVGLSSGLEELPDIRMFAGYSLAAAIAWSAWIIVGAWVAYWGIFALRFFTESIKSIMYSGQKMMLDFVDDSLYYTISKSIEIYGEDTAIKAYDLLIENVVINQKMHSSKDEPHYRKIETRKLLTSDEE